MTREATPINHAIRISQNAFDQLLDIAPGWDRDALEVIDIEWAASLDPARNEDARFLNWAQSFTKGKPPP